MSEESSESNEKDQARKGRETEKVCNTQVRKSWGFTQDQEVPDFRLS